MKLNLNDRVSVTLTKKGADIYNQAWKDYSTPQMKEGDVITTQLWALFRDFGDYINLGYGMPFEFGIITLEEK